MTGRLGAIQANVLIALANAVPREDRYLGIWYTLGALGLIRPTDSRVRAVSVRRACNVLAGQARLSRAYVFRAPADNRSVLGEAVGARWQMVLRPTFLQGEEFDMLDMIEGITEWRVGLAAHRYEGSNRDCECLKCQRAARQVSKYEQLEDGFATFLPDNILLLGEARGLPSLGLYGSFQAKVRDTPPRRAISRAHDLELP